MSAPSKLPEPPDLWAPVGTTGLPEDLLAAVEHRDWARVRELAPTASRGIFGRQAAQLRARFQLGVDPVLTQHRGWSALLTADWDDLDRCLAARPMDPIELAGLRDVILAPLGDEVVVQAPSEAAAIFFGAWDNAQSGMIGRYRRLVRRMLGWRSEPLALEHGVSTSRHARYRRLQDAFLLALQESIGGRLDIAAAIANEALHLGEQGDALRVLAADLAGGVAAARGGSVDWPLAYPAHLLSARGQSPLDAGNYLLTLMPFFALRRDDSFDWMTKLVHSIAIRVSGPRMLLRAEAWRLAAEIHGGADPSARTAALLVKARRAGPGIRALPLLLDAITTRRIARFAEAERAARRAGAMWLQVAALTWMAALNPDASTTRWLYRTLVVSGWRRPALVPAEIAAEASLGLTAAGIRDRAVIELASAAGRPNVSYEVARRHIEDARASEVVHLAGVDALAALGTTHARELLHRLARRSDPIGRAAENHVAHGHSINLSEREVEVLDLTAHGMTNKEIGARLGLSPHTVARHLANARSKLGASNRAEAAAKLGELERR